ncbi:hypothetical protein [Nocardioides sp. B-3]|uniref:hypothetical protein n=1 Tax=Nocardioides sp. B-3 TaxID=2895565 RepID=UPI002152067F|nr:hypothetical protein [Nocardioides sp. B-3]UUZ60171.1 hypothetical protein LP418_04295 [Nocardioides sp. B-3]
MRGCPPSPVGERRGLFLRLVGTGLARAGLVGVTAVAMPVLLATPDAVRRCAAATVLLVGAPVLGLVRSRERVLGESLGQHYVREIRTGLVASSPVDDRTSLGITVARTTNDLTSVRNWIALGVTPIAVGGATDGRDARGAGAAGAAARAGRGRADGGAGGRAPPAGPHLLRPLPGVAAPARSPGRPSRRHGPRRHVDPGRWRAASRAAPRRATRSAGDGRRRGPCPGGRAHPRCRGRGRRRRGGDRGDHRRVDRLARRDDRDRAHAGGGAGRPGGRPGAGSSSTASPIVPHGASSARRCSRVPTCGRHVRRT